MASYEDDHNITPNTTPAPTPRRPRLDLDFFFSAVSASGTHQPHDGDPFLLLAQAFSAAAPLLAEVLRGDAAEGKEAQGVPDGFLDTLERVSKKTLKEGDTCAICNEKFLDDPYPLVVRLPCHRNHVFDLECIAPWLLLKTTCPLDRKELVKKPEPVVIPAEEEEEEEWDDNYG